MPTFSVRISDSAAQRFDAAAAQAGGRSAMLRRLIQEAGAPDGLPAPERAPRVCRLMVRLRTEDAAGVALEAQAMGLSPAGWVAALVSYRVRGRPRFSRPSELVLTAVRGEVHRIGVNVNQIARALNAAVLEGRVLDLELTALDDLRLELRRHLSSLREAFEGNLAYWQAEP